MDKKVIVKLPKNGDLSDCNNWRGTILLLVLGKVFCKVLLSRLQTEAYRTLREEQVDFRNGRCCSEQIYTLRNITEQTTEFQKRATLNFTDFKKTFDSVHRLILWDLREIYQYLQDLVQELQLLHQDGK